MRISVAYNADLAHVHGTERDDVAVTAVREAAHAVVEACRHAGHEVTPVPLQRDLRDVCGSLAEIRGDLIFNLVEGLGGESRLEAAVAWLFELGRLPYTGAPPETLSLALDKARAKAVLRSHGVPVVDDRLVSRGDEPLEGLHFPVIVKPVREDASHGIDSESVVVDAEAARARARLLIERYGQPALVETFLPGRELNVAILGEGSCATTLDLAEIDFSGYPAGRPPLVTYAAKWEEDSDEYRGTPAVAARALEPSQADRVRRIALEAYRALGLRDYGRVDLRFDAQGRPFVLEVNPNPDISPDAGLARAAQRSGISYDDLIARIVDSACARR